MRVWMLALISLTVCGCMAKPRCGSALRFELRNGEGALRLRIADAVQSAMVKAGDLNLCDPAGQRLGTLVWNGPQLRLLDRNGTETLRADTDKSLDIASQTGNAMRLFRDERELRVLKFDGVPYGSLHRPSADLAIVSDPGGAPLARVTPRDPDAAISGADGLARGFVVPSPGLEAAAMFAFEDLPLEQRAFLAAHLARSRFQKPR